MSDQSDPSTAAPKTISVTPLSTPPISSENAAVGSSGRRTPEDDAGHEGGDETAAAVGIGDAERADGGDDGNDLDPVPSIDRRRFATQSA